MDMPKELDDCDYYNTSGDSPYHCKLCKKAIVQFVWSTTRGFDQAFIEKVFNIPEYLILKIDVRGKLKEYKIPNGVPICLDCVKKYDLFNRHKRLRK